MSQWKTWAVAGLLAAGLAGDLRAQTASAQAGPAQAVLKIGVVNMEQALMGTAEGQKAAQSLSAKMEPQQKDFDARQREIASLTEQLSKGASLLSEEKKNQLTRDIETKKKKLQRDAQDADESLRSEQQQLLQSLGQRLATVITKYAKDNGYTLVVQSGGANDAVVFSASANDITKAVAQVYDRTYPAPTPHP